MPGLVQGLRSRVGRGAGDDLARSHLARLASAPGLVAGGPSAPDLVLALA